MMAACSFCGRTVRSLSRHYAQTKICGIKAGYLRAPPPPPAVEAPPVEPAADDDLKFDLRPEVAEVWSESCRPGPRARPCGDSAYPEFARLAAPACV